MRSIYLFGSGIIFSTIPLSHVRFVTYISPLATPDLCKSVNENMILLQVQTLLIIHLSIIEIFGNICWFIIDSTEVLEQVGPSSYAETIEVAQDYISIVTSTTFLFVYYMVMVRSHDKTEMFVKRSIF